MTKVLGIRLLLITLVLFYGWWSFQKIDSLKTTILERDSDIKGYIDTIAINEKNNKVSVAVLTNYYESLLSISKASELVASQMVTDFLNNSKKKPVVENVKILTEPDVDNIRGLVNRMHEIYRNAHCINGTRCID